MIEKLDIKNGGVEDLLNCIKKINELVDAVNKLETMAKNTNTVLKSLVEENKTPAENVQPDYVTTSYPTDGHTKEYYGQNGASIVTDHPLPAGYVITIRESETKGE